MEKDQENEKKYAMKQNAIGRGDEKKLDWMYKGPNQLINREEYLLGRPIDKSFEQMVQVEKDNELNHTTRNHVEHECIPPSLRFFSGNEQVDLVRKMQEDPLYVIKKKEIETRNQLLKNPVKLKQLQQLLAEQSKKNRNRKKAKKKKYKEDIDSNDEEQLDLLLTAKYKQLKEKISDKDFMRSMKRIQHKQKKKLKKRCSRSSSESENSSDEDASNRNMEKDKNNGSTIEKVKECNKKKILLDGKVDEKRIKARSSSRDSSSQERKNRFHKKNMDNRKVKNFRSRSPPNRRDYCFPKYNAKSSNKYKDASNKLQQRERNSNEKDYKEDRNKDKWNCKNKQGLTEEEKERRRQEMIANATWRDKERERNVRRYQVEEKKEVDSGKVYNNDFVRKQLATAAEMSSIASRIKSNINNIQRSGGAMDTNFAKR